MDKQPTWTPCRELEASTAGDVTPTPNPEPAWRTALRDRLLRKVFMAPIADAVIQPRAADSDVRALAELVVELVVDQVGAADQILAEGMEQLEAKSAEAEKFRAAHSAALVTASSLRRELEALRSEHAQLARDFDELGITRNLLGIELERARDHAQDLEIKLAGMELRATTAEAAERKLRGGN